MSVQPPICPIDFAATEEACPHCFDTSVHVRVPTAGVDSVRKAQCEYCYNTCAHHEGVFVCMGCFQGFCGGHVQKHTHVTDHAMFVRIYQQPPPPEEEKKGFEDIGKEVPPEYEATMVCVPCKLQHFDGVGETFDSMLGIVNFEPPAVVDALTEDAWLQKVVCAHCDNVATVAEPFFSPASPPPPQPTCIQCAHADNNWMCLTCGAVGCPRAEAGGKGHAIEHFKSTHHALVVKLGTITPQGADVHCYACDAEVKVASLKAALGRLGVDMDAGKKTAKSLAEQMYDFSMKFDSNRITEEGAKLVPAGGPGRTGLHNFGNTCYMNSVLQLIFATAAFQARWGAPRHILECRAKTPSACFECQMERLGTGLCSGEFAKFPDDEAAHRRFDGLTPRDFKALLAGNHPEFKTGKQQDASEYFGYLMTQIVRKDYASALPTPTNAFELTVERRTGCAACGGCKYAANREWALRLPVPVEPVEAPLGPDGKPLPMTDEEIEAMRPKTTLARCLEAWAAESEIAGVTCQGCHAKSNYVQTSHVTTFPDVLAIVLQREYFCRRELTAKKLDVLVDVPDELDLTPLRRARPPGEKVWESSAAAPQAGTLEPDAGVPKAGTAKPAVVVDEVALATVASMGIDYEAARWALQETNNNVERAIDWVFSHPEGPPAGAAAAPVAPPAADASPVPRVNSKAAETKLTDGPGKYELFGLISHIGKAATSGHYVAHVKKDGQWLNFNDEKVALSQKPPKQFATMYFFRRVASA